MTASFPQPLPRMHRIRTLSGNPNLDKMLLHQQSLNAATLVASEIERGNAKVTGAIHQGSVQLNDGLIHLGKILTSDELVPDDKIDETCVEEALTFVRALNALEDKIADSHSFKPISKKGTYWDVEDLKTHKDRCLEILSNHQLQSDYEDEFMAIGKHVNAAHNERALRIADIHNFRYQILDFLLSSECESPSPVVV